ncbi:OmpA family protein [Pseudomonas sp. CFBP 13602]|nr:OmpA family protein [Pseudomonas sp. CFBP 13602]
MKLKDLSRTVLPALLVAGVLSGCTTSPEGASPLNSRTWPVCSVLGGLAGGGLGAIESGAWAAGGGLAGAVVSGLVCYAQDGDKDEDGVFDRRDRCPDTPANTPVKHNGCPLPVYPAVTKAPEPPVADIPEVVTLSDAGDVPFEFGSAELTSSARTELTSLAARMKTAQVAMVKIVGHTDSVGSDAFNQKLSEQRAASVVSFLLGQGVAADKLSSEGRGESEPVDSNDTDAGRAKNRRVEIHLSH